MTWKTRRDRSRLASWPAFVLLAALPLGLAKSEAPARAAEEVKPRTPVLKGIVIARGSMSTLWYKVEGNGHLIADAPKFDLTTSVPLSQLTSAKPLVVLASPKGVISLKVTQEISIKDKTVVPYTIVGGTGAYAKTAGSGRIRIELINRSGLSGTVKLTFVGPGPAASTDSASK